MGTFLSDGRALTAKAAGVLAHRARRMEKGGGERGESCRGGGRGPLATTPIAAAEK
jgi:hypothetical protein